jgi:hypothetical protein
VKLASCHLFGAQNFEVNLTLFLLICAPLYDTVHFVANIKKPG